METVEPTPESMPEQMRMTTPSPSLLSCSNPSSSSSIHSLSSQRNIKTPETDDTMSVASSASSMVQNEFTIPDIWRPSIMACIQAPSIEERKKHLTVSIRGEISRDLVTQMYAFKQKPDRSFCTYVAKCLVKKHPFMRDTGKNVSGYVSLHITYNSYRYFVCSVYMCAHLHLRSVRMSSSPVSHLAYSPCFTDFWRCHSYNFHHFNKNVLVLYIFYMHV